MSTRAVVVSFAAVCFALLRLAGPGFAQTTAPAPSLAVRGALPKSGALTIAELEALGPTKATYKGHDKVHQVYGVPLERVLTHFGFEPGAMGKDVPVADKRSGWRKVVVASAPDGYATVLSCAELFASMGPTKALLIWKMDGKPLPPETGPFRLVVLTDKEPSRSVRNLDVLEVVAVPVPKRP